MAISPRKRGRCWWTLGISGLLLLSAIAGCTPPDTADAESDATPSPKSSSADERSPVLSDAARDRILDAAATELGIPRAELQIFSVSQAVWPDGCLGLANPGEVCTLALVPGWQVEVGQGDQRLIYRTDEQAHVLRRQPPD